jgi:hypothetical protein
MEMKWIAIQTIIIFPIIIIISAWIWSSISLSNGFYFFTMTLIPFLIYEGFFYHYSVMGKKNLWDREDALRNHHEDREDQKSKRLEP